MYAIASIDNYFKYYHLGAFELRFLSFGGLFQGGFQYFIWNAAASELSHLQEIRIPWMWGHPLGLGLSNPEKVLIGWKACLVRSEVVFESLWPGRSRYASLCKLAAASRVKNMKQLWSLINLMPLTRPCIFLASELRLPTWSLTHCSSSPPSTSWRRPFHGSGEDTICS